jgi:hypothetical protein
VVSATSVRQIHLHAGERLTRPEQYIADSGGGIIIFRMLLTWWY